MNNSITLPAPVLDLPALPRTKFEREHDAFCRLLPQLLTTHRGRFVAIHEEQVVETGDDKLDVAVRVLKRIGNVDIYVGLVSDAPALVSHSGVRREIRPGGEVP